MSLTYWCIEGIGFSVDDIFGKLVPEKLITKMEKTLRNKNNEAFQKIKEKIQKCDNPAQKIDFLSDYIDFHYDWGWAEVIAEGYMALLTNDNGQGKQFVYFPPMLPWEISATTPKTAQEVNDILVSCLKEVTEMTDAEAANVIDQDLFEVGCS